MSAMTVRNLKDYIAAAAERYEQIGNGNPDVYFNVSVSARPNMRLDAYTAPGEDSNLLVTCKTRGETSLYFVCNLLDPIVKKGMRKSLWSRTTTGATDSYEDMMRWVKEESPSDSLQVKLAILNNLWYDGRLTEAYVIEDVANRPLGCYRDGQYACFMLPSINLGKNVEAHIYSQARKLAESSAPKLPAVLGKPLKSLTDL